MVLYLYAIIFGKKAIVKVHWPKKKYILLKLYAERVWIFFAMKIVIVTVMMMIDNDANDCDDDNDNAWPHQ